MEVAGAHLLRNVAGEFLCEVKRRPSVPQVGNVAVAQRMKAVVYGAPRPRLAVDGLALEQHIGHHTPRAFLVLAHDDKVVLPINSLNYYEELYVNKVPASMHIYPTGGHGFGIRQSFAYHLEMMLELKAWLRSF